MVVDLAQSGVARSPLSSFDVTGAAAIDLSAAGATIGEPGEFSPRTLTVLAAGFTWEHPSHVFLKRARARRSLLGSPAQQLDTLAGHIFETLSSQVLH